MPWSFHNGPVDEFCSMQLYTNCLPTLAASWSSHVDNLLSNAPINAWFSFFVSLLKSVVEFIDEIYAVYKCLKMGISEICERERYLLLLLDNWCVFVSGLLILIPNLPFYCYMFNYMYICNVKLFFGTIGVKYISATENRKLFQRNSIYNPVMLFYILSKWCKVCRTN